MTRTRTPLLFLSLLPLAAVAAASVPAIAPWAEADLNDWETREFAGSSEYAVTQIDGVQVLDARTEGTASVLYRTEKVDLSANPMFSWSWKVDSVYDNPNEQAKLGDDFPARVYVVIQTGFLPWDTHAINYVFASETPAGSEWLNPYTEKAMMVAVRSGTDATGQWHLEQRNVAEDFAKAFPDVFPEPPSELSGYAIMVDGDNGGYSGQALFGGISFGPK